MSGRLWRMWAHHDADLGWFWHVDAYPCVADQCESDDVQVEVLEVPEDGPLTPTHRGWLPDGRTEPVIIGDYWPHRPPGDQAGPGAGRALALHVQVADELDPEDVAYSAAWARALFAQGGNPEGYVESERDVAASLRDFAAVLQRLGQDPARQARLYAVADEIEARINRRRGASPREDGQQ